jgi:hypothetical protein
MYRARFYDPATGRFIQEDPLAPFRFEYAENNPLVFSDPTGGDPALEYAELLCGIIGQVREVMDAEAPLGEEIEAAFQAVLDGLNGVGGGGTPDFGTGILDHVLGLALPATGSVACGQGIPVQPVRRGLTSLAGD